MSTRLYLPSVVLAYRRNVQSKAAVVGDLWGIGHFVHRNASFICSTFAVCGTAPARSCQTMRWLTLIDHALVACGASKPHHRISFVRNTSGFSPFLSQQVCSTVWASTFNDTCDSVLGVNAVEHAPKPLTIIVISATCYEQPHRLQPSSPCGITTALSAVIALIPLLPPRSLWAPTQTVPLPDSAG